MARQPFNRTTGTRWTQTYANPHYGQRPLYLACRLWVAMLRLGVA